MSTDRPRRGQDKEGVVIPLRSSTPTSDDLREYLPSKGAVLEALDEARATPENEPDPALVEKLRQMNEADAERASKPSPWSKNGAGIDTAALPSSAGPKEGVAPKTQAAKPAAPASRRRALPAWKVLAAVAAVAVPVVLTIVVMRAEMRELLARPDAVKTAPSTTAEASGPGKAAPSATAEVPPAVSVSASAAPSMQPSAPPAKSATAPKSRPRRTAEDPYDAAVVPSATATADPKATAAPSTAPTPTPSGPTPWFP